MKQKIVVLLTFCISFIAISAQSINDPNLRNHEYFIEKLNNSQDNFYNQVIEKYDNYLAEYPKDVLVEIEKLNFVNYAQYDEYEEYNPNQDYFDSCKLDLKERYPYEPAVLLFLTTCSWGEELDKVFAYAKISIRDNYPKWTTEQLGTVYYEMAKQHFYDEKYEIALSDISKASRYDSSYKESIEYPKILINLNKNEEAIRLLVLGNDTSSFVWNLSQKADMLLELEQFNEALKIYNLINEIDSAYADKSELADVMAGLGEFDLAREYLIADTGGYWLPENSMRKLFLHDLAHSGADSALESYNLFRDYGYSNDPIAIYRFQLFFTHPFLGWKFRDLLGLFSMIILLAVLILIPSIWILPTYAIGHKFNVLGRTKSSTSTWGLKSFWWVSASYLIASFIALLSVPETFNSLLSLSDYGVEETPESLGKMSLVFILAFAALAFATLRKVDVKAVFLGDWDIEKTIKSTLGLFIIFKIVSVIYILTGMKIFDIDITELMVIPDVLMSSKAEIEALISNYGKWAAILLAAGLVPVYEELIFRGVILNSATRYLTFNWANILQSFLFAAVHMDLFLFPVFFAFGIITGILQKRSGGLLSGILFHVVNNLMAVGLMISRS